MNSIHEPGPNGDSKISPSRKPVRKIKLDARAPSWPNRHAQVRTGAPRRAHGRRIMVRSPAMSWQGAGSVAGPSGRIAASLPHAPRASASSPAPSASACSPLAPATRPAPYRGRPTGRVAGPSAVSQRAPGHFVGVSARHAWAQPAQLPSHSTIFCIAAKIQPN